MSSSSPDTLYAAPLSHVVDFAFDESVAAVFPDMLRRSVPGYETVISLLGVIAAHHAVDGSRIYDLGCSLGAASLAIHRQLQGRSVDYVAVDSSEAMIARCRENLARHIASDRVSCRTEDILESDIAEASVVVLNFTLQFVDPGRRAEMIEKIFAGLRPGGVLILSEKVVGASDEEDRALSDLYYRFKSANGYSELEISQKRNALERVMLLDSVEQHLQRLGAAGFESSTTWFQCFNFASMLAVKPSK